MNKKIKLQFENIKLEKGIKEIEEDPCVLSKYLIDDNIKTKKIDILKIDYSKAKDTLDLFSIISQEFYTDNQWMYHKKLINYIISNNKDLHIIGNDIYYYRDISFWTKKQYIVVIPELIDSLDNINKKNMIEFKIKNICIKDDYNKINKKIDLNIELFPDNESQLILSEFILDYKIKKEECRKLENREKIKRNKEIKERHNVIDNIKNILNI